ncbi:hypothetical protein BH11BAC7_BH11BAC7_36660 [soil metagenome]
MSAIASILPYFSERSILLIHKYKFSATDIPKSRIAIILEEPRNGNFLMATTSASLILPPGNTFKEGIVKDMNGKILCYHFLKEKPVCEDNIFEFDLDCSVGLMRSYSVFPKNATTLANTYQASIIHKGKLSVEHFKELLYAIYKCPYMDGDTRELLLPCVEKYHGRLSA